jgi:hypothetical protein
MLCRPERPASMNAAHLHLLLNHVPVLGSLAGVVLLACAVLSPRQPARTAALVLLVIGGAFGVATYLTGEPAEEIVEASFPDIPHRLIHEHEDAAGWAVWLLGIAGGLALVLLWVARRRAVHRGWLALLLVIATMTAVATVRTAASGGHIHHPETRPDFVSGGEDEQDAEDDAEDDE